MKRLLSILSAASLIGSAQCAAVADNQSTQMFDKVKSLAGTWKGKDDDGQPATLTYEVTSGGTAVIEKLTPGSWPCMITMYNLDGNSVMATHYCNRNNQPRMRASSIDPKTGSIKFDFVDATNLAKPEDGHMHSLALNFPDDKHLVQDWEWKEGDEARHSLFKFEKGK